MVITIDSAGRLVVPKSIREELGLSPGAELEIRLVDRRIEIEVATTPMRLESTDYGVVAVADRPMPTLSADTVRDTLERVRR